MGLYAVTQEELEKNCITKFWIGSCGFLVEMAKDGWLAPNRQKYNFVLRNDRVKSCLQLS